MALKPSDTANLDQVMPSAPSEALRKAHAEAALGVKSPQLANLLREHWAWVLSTSPLRATQLGVRDYDDKLGDNSPVGIEAARKQRRLFLARAKALPMASLSEADRISTELLIANLQSKIDAEVCDFHLWTVSPRENPITEINELHELHKIKSSADAMSLLDRYAAYERQVINRHRHLQKGATAGLVATRESISRVIAMVNKQLAEPLAEWPMLKPATASGPTWKDESKLSVKKFRVSLRDLVGNRLKPVLAEYARVLEQILLPMARGDEKSGLLALPNGEKCYRARIRNFTTLGLDAKTVHETGVREIAKTDAEMLALVGKTLGTTALAETLSKLRGDESLYFASEQQVVDAGQATLDHAKQKMGSYFGILPKADCVMRRIPAYEAPYTTIAYYRPPHADGSKPGEYFINVYQPRTRPRFEAVVLAIHEAIPGHHLQIAISQELSAVPAFRKHGGITAFVEGWGLYTERLGLEMGLYKTDLDRIGMVSFDAWRAGRLVVDTGIHAFGWSRSKARAYLEEHTALSKENIDNEVDRYINWPGQALGYKIGQLEFWALRREAEQKLGDRFALKELHDVMLGRGAVSLPQLRRRVRGWIASKQ